MNNNDFKEVNNGNRIEYSTTEQSAYIAKHSEKYVVKFKIVEIYERIKNYFSK